MLALTIILGAAAAFAFFGWWRDAKAFSRQRGMLEYNLVEASEDQAKAGRALAEARRLLSDKRCHGRIDATRGAWESERDRWIEVTK